MDPVQPSAQPEAARPPAFAPEAFGRYYLIDRIAMGGMAEIFKAKTFGHGGFENILVIKRILTHLSEDQQFVRMFMDEAKITALLQHTNIVRIYDFGKIQSNYFIAMECVEGKDAKQILRKMAERRKLLPREFAVYITMEAAKGLDYAHKRTTLQGQPLNIVHRDVSPSNILVSYNGEIKVADFGIVKAENVAEDTDAGMLKGKFEYMSPEQASGKDLDRRSDIYSLGIVLWEMLTGRRLFKSDSEIKTLDRIKSGDIDPPSTINPQVPARLDEIVMRALATNPDDRYADARDFHADLLDFLYPAPPDVTQQSLAHFMQGLFVEELAVEHNRLEEGTRIAQALHETAASVELEPTWEESGNTRSQAQPAPEPPRQNKAVWGIMAVLLATVVVLGSLLAWFLITQATQPTPTPTPAPIQVMAGNLKLNIAPVAGNVFVDGQPVGEGTSVLIKDLSSEVDHVLKVEADGYQPFETSTRPEAGQTEPIAVVLTPISSTPTPDPEQTNNPVGERPVLRVSSRPSGAEVLVGGRSVGRTPWERTTEPNERVRVELRMNNYENVSFQVTMPKTGMESRDLVLTPSGSRATPQPTPSTTPAPAANGKLCVAVKGDVQWVTVSIDGSKKGDAPRCWDVAAGTHDVRLVNAEANIDTTRRVEVKPGEKTSITP